MGLLVIWQLWQEFRAKTALNPRRRYSGCESSRLVMESRSSIDFFTSRTLSSNSTAQARSPAKANAENGVCGSVHDSLPYGGCKVDSLPDTLPDFLEPHSWVGAVNHAPQKAQPLGCIIAVSPDVVLRDLGVQGEKGIQVPGFGKDVSRVAKLRGFDDHGFLHVEDVFLPKQIDPACPACELAIEERVIIRAPTDLGDIKVAGSMQLGTHSLQFCFLDCPIFKAQSDLVQSPRILPETMIGSFGGFDLLLEIGRQFDLQPARQCSFPGNELPLLTTLAVFAALYERALELDLGSQQMLPLVPGAVPWCVQDGLIEPEFQLTTRVAAQCPVVVEITSAHWHMKPPAPEIWRKGENAARKERRSVTGRLAEPQSKSQLHSHF